MSNPNQNAANVQTADFSRHGKLKLKPDTGFAHAKSRNLAAVSISELGIASSNFPIVLIKNPGDQRYLLMAVLGLKTGENIYYGEEFWESTYVPLSVQRHPFVVGFDDRDPGATQLATCLETDSACLSEKEGLPLYTDDGKETQTLRTAQQMLSVMFEQGKFTEQFIQKLQELDLIVPFELDLHMQARAQQQGEVNKITGMFTVDEVKLKALSAEQLKDLQTRDFLSPCHLMMVSLYQLNQLIRRRNRLGGQQIVNFRIRFAGDEGADKAAAANNS
jgi:hypothetical protein